MESLFREIPYELERALQNMDFEKFEEFYHSLMNRYHTLGYEDFCEDVQQYYKQTGDISNDDRHFFRTMVQFCKHSAATLDASAPEADFIYTMISIDRINGKRISLDRIVYGRRILKPIQHAILNIGAQIQEEEEEEEENLRNVLRPRKSPKKLNTPVRDSPKKDIRAQLKQKTIRIPEQPKAATPVKDFRANLKAVYPEKSTASPEKQMDFRGQLQANKKVAPQRPSPVKQNDFRHNLKKRVATKPVKADSPVKQMDFRNVLKKRS
eukprot:TRINITY_DN1140_c0_g1_i1.p1 TRINITY_DN1140_c0_g1~~TRINITY_DN1140_c0_g1_i1.p1  ORF type:complete len:267 (-),score=56.66 TRINITY_DN1140_c0_g1_i1:21-821(-)